MSPNDPKRTSVAKFAVMHNVGAFSKIHTGICALAAYLDRETPDSWAEYQS
jgi:hypothetical protein